MEAWYVSYDGKNCEGQSGGLAVFWKRVRERGAI
jgi:hypothetical protein